MRMFAQDAAFYRRVRVDETDHPEALRRLKQLEAIDRMRERFTLAEALSMMEVGRSTYYERKRRLREEGAKGLVPRSSRPKSHPGRQWTMADARRVLDVRREMPWAGKARVALELAERRPQRALSEATVGRILQWAVKTERAQPCSFCEGRVAAKRRRDFTGAHARRWKPRDKHVGVQRAARGTLRPHDDAHRRQDVQGGSGGLFESGRLPRHPAAARQGVFERHGAHRQGVPGRGRGAARHPGRAGGRRLGVHGGVRGRLQEARPGPAGAAAALAGAQRHRSMPAEAGAPTARCASSAGASTRTTSPAPR